MIKSRRNGLENSVWPALFLKMGMWILPMVEEASFPNKIIMHQFKPKSKKIINLQIIPTPLEYDPLFSKG